MLLSVLASVAGKHTITLTCLHGHPLVSHNPDKDSLACAWQLPFLAPNSETREQRLTSLKTVSSCASEVDKPSRVNASMPPSGPGTAAALQTGQHWAAEASTAYRGETLCTMATML